MGGAVIADVPLPDSALLLRLYRIWFSEQKGHNGRLEEGRSELLRHVETCVGIKKDMLDSSSASR